MLGEDIKDDAHATIAFVDMIQYTRPACPIHPTHLVIYHLLGEEGKRDAYLGPWRATDLLKENKELYINGPTKAVVVFKPDSTPMSSPCFSMLYCLEMMPWQRGIAIKGTVRKRMSGYT